MVSDKIVYVAIAVICFCHLTCGNDYDKIEAENALFSLLAILGIMYVAIAFLRFILA